MRCGTGQGTLGEVWDGSGDPSKVRGVSGNLLKVWDVSGERPKVRDGL